MVLIYDWISFLFGKRITLLFRGYVKVLYFMNSKSYQCCIIGAGPAGLGAALELSKHGIRDLIIIDKHKIPGGLARTETFGGVRFDIGPHRFFTKNHEVNALWHDTMGRDFIPVDRLTRIYYKSRYFSYPINVFDTLSKLGPFEALHALVSFVSARIVNQSIPTNFEEWIIHKFGRKLYNSFFKTYTEKVWGIPCRQISPEWAAQRIKNLDIIEVIKKAIMPNTATNIKTLIEQFDFPILGAGQMYERMCEKISSQGAVFMMSCKVIAINRRGSFITSVDVKRSDDTHERISASQFFSSIPLTHFFQMLDPPESDLIKRAAESLYFRDHITVNLAVDSDFLFPDQWIYIHSPDVRMARLANYNNFSRKMVGKKNVSALSVEYFVFKTDDLWNETDDNLKSLAINELSQMKLLKASAVRNAWVVRETECYPTYFIGFQHPYCILQSRVDQFANLFSIGRGGMYKYNNQDHSIFSGILAARNYLKLPGSPFNLWNINIDAEYLENAERTS